jgi:PAS domain S-box-containing protein
MERTIGLDANPQQPEQIFQSSFTYASIGMALVAVNGQWLDVNPALCELVGYSKEELLQMTFQDITHPDDLPADLEVARQLVNGEIRSYQIEKRYIHKNGRTIWVFLSVSIACDAAKQPLCFITQILDITERKSAEERLQHSEERYRTLFNSIDEGFCIFEILFDEQEKPLDLLFLEMNTAFKKYSELNHITAGKTVLELYPDSERWWIDTYSEVARTGEPKRFKKEFAVIGHWFDIYAFRYGGPKSRKVAVVFNDLTERSLAGSEIEQMQQSFDKHIKELEAALAEVKMLKGVIAICSYCKNIRTEDNFWMQVEDYITRHTGALFSHSICPKCYDKAMGDLHSAK